ncbi:uncharacterized protein ALTATR162_LOCUS5028 [Alternaria atra]|uniref:Secreted protein n=1 Tax=Alternaria atra TaxID=119953 RepID=A0A8J2N5N8_9PLEO|nr:uncharacterized protein ALTATR162_LOCUS5028 [Alternaria atra]CAG5158186.1 unnamed protein product [Alternaria atra]
MKLVAILALCSIGVTTRALATQTTSGPGDRKPLYDALPAGAPDGLHMGSLNPDGTTHWEYIGEAEYLPFNSSELPSGVPTILTKRSDYGTHCDGGYLPDSEWTRAASGLQQICGDGRDYTGVLTYQYGSTIAYACNYGNGQRCVSHDVWNYQTQLRNACYEQRGWFSIPSAKLSYGMTLVHNGFC